MKNNIRLVDLPENHSMRNLDIIRLLKQAAPFLQEYHIGFTLRNNIPAFIFFCTEKHTCSISFYPPTPDKPKGYIGGYINNLYQRPGEDWHRGNDLPDGPYGLETVQSIIHSFLQYEILPLSKSLKIGDNIPDEPAMMGER